jgi:hypothetical protein
MGDFQEAQQIGGFLIGPAIAGDGREAEHADGGIGDQGQDALDIRAGGTGEVVILDEEALVTGASGGG